MMHVMHHNSATRLTRLLLRPFTLVQMAVLPLHRYAAAVADSLFCYAMSFHCGCIHTPRCTLTICQHEAPHTLSGSGSHHSGTRW